jgi:hypothetical protein
MRRKLLCGRPTHNRERLGQRCKVAAQSDFQRRLKLPVVWRDLPGVQDRKLHGRLLQERMLPRANRRLHGKRL